MNSCSFLKTVLRKAQCPERKLGNYPTMYMISEAINALFPLPLDFSHKFSSSLITDTTNLISYASLMHPEIEPIAQHSLFRRSIEK